MIGAIVVMLLVGLFVPVPSQADAQLTGEPFMIAVIPDTQIYVQSNEGAAVFASQFQWIVDNQIERNIVFTTHEGDVAQNPASVVEWDRIEEIFAILDLAEMPYSISPGNHDIAPGGAAPEYDARFGAARFADQPWYGASHSAEGNRSSYSTISVEGHELLFLHVRHLLPSFGSVQPVLDWVDDVLQAHPDHLVFVTTHEFTAPDGSVVMAGLQAAISNHCNVAAVFSGHRTAGASRGSFTDSCDRVVHHLLTNYQQISGGGQGFLRTVEVDPLTLSAQFEVYSPTLDEFRTGSAESFSVDLAKLVAVPGDASCDRGLSVTDALLIAQYSVGNRSGVTTCPLADPATQLNLAEADVNGDQIVNVTDALLIARCTVGIPNTFCPQ